MTQLLSGTGYPVFRDLGTTIPGFRFAEPVSIKIANNSSEVVSYKMVGGRKVVAGAKQQNNENTATMSIEAGSWEALELAEGIASAVSPSLNLSEQRTRTIPTTAPFEIVDPDLATTSGVQVIVLDNGVWGKSGGLTLLATGAPATGQFVVTTVGTKLTFNAAQAGAPIVYTLIKNYTGLRTIGREPAVARLTTLGFEGLVFSEDTNQIFKIVIPRMIKTKSPSYDFGEKTTLELEYRMVVAPGQQKDFFLVEMPVGYNPG